MVMGTVTARVKFLVMAMARAIVLAMHGNGKRKGYGNSYCYGNAKGEVIFIGSGRVNVQDIVICRYCMQHC